MIGTQRSTNGIPAVGRGIKTLSGGCMKGKPTVIPFRSRSERKTSLVLALVHTDVMGPMKTVSKGGAWYALTFVDDFLGFVIGYFLQNKSDVTAKLAEFKAFYESQWGEHLKCILERSILTSEWRLCVPGTASCTSPQQNGVVERMNRTIVEKARIILYYKGVPTIWWAEAVGTTVYLINRSTNTDQSVVTAYELEFKVKRRLEHLRVLGSQGYANIDDAKRTKLETKRFQCLSSGLARTKGYRVYDLEAFKVKVSRSVKRDEHEVGGIYDSSSPQL
ncbi:LOW QUALITY PROTEIN: hypothetical protein PHMEG_00012918 [Phytophthora megakarya]|uniref:Integrase catalytic domain-containing protein n=1 Tax=Phytophthora megakarya TaxID=4795 RepID=A0A225W9P5_9STRA|nr:LOW QUALITY PROTEIN: hypothetical protein PHMEG_00012918 [Phytophthora megakarya]